MKSDLLEIQEMNVCGRKQIIQGKFKMVSVTAMIFHF